MTVKEFKTDFPEFAHLEGDELWNKMEDTMLKNAQPATKEDMEKFFAHPKSHDGLPLESYRMLFIDTTKHTD